MLLRSFFLTLFFALSALAQPVTNTDENLVTLQNIKSEYNSFYGIAPVIVNKSKRKIYSYNIGWGLKILRYDEQSQQWESGIFGFRCGMSALQARDEVEKPLLPISAYQLRLNTIAFSGNQFRLLVKEATLPINGKYKFVFEYAYKPWDSPYHQATKPAQTFLVESPEFIITSEQKPIKSVLK